MTKTFPTAVVLSITTGKLVCQFADMHEAVEWLVQTPVWTHQFAHGEFNDALRRGIYAQIPNLEKVDASHINQDNWQEFVSQCVERFGAALTLRPFDIEQKELEASFVEPLGMVGHE